MELVSEEQIRQYIKEGNLKDLNDVQSMIKDLFASTVQEMLEAEMDTHLGYAKHSKKNKDTENRRNGHSKEKVVTSELGDFTVALPRDRQSELDPLIVKKHQKRMPSIEDQVIALYARGVSTRDIGAHLHPIYGVDISPTLVSNLTDRLLPRVQEWQNRPLQTMYSIVFLDAIHDKVRQDGHVQSKAAYRVVGIDLDGQKDVLGMWIGEKESAKFWLGVLTDLKSRGVQDILVVCTDHLRGFTEAMASCYPKADVQKCIVHPIRNTLKYVSTKDYKAVTASLKPVYQAPTEEAALLELDRFEQEWGKKYPLSVRTWRENWAELATFYRYPLEMRRVMYTTNIIEGYHRQLRKVTKGKSIFPNDKALTKMLYLATMEVTRKWTMRVAKWGQILG
ncbi:MAG: IS256 family transposase [Alicyclobacillaceae bacterium]|nr:IS256 family transposase [Alicyclobacillaceae bacterium]